jgi:hypothetical protein
VPAAASWSGHLKKQVPEAKSRLAWIETVTCFLRSDRGRCSNLSFTLEWSTSKLAQQQQTAIDAQDPPLSGSAWPSCQIRARTGSPLQSSTRTERPTRHSLTWATAGGGVAQNDLRFPSLAQTPKHRVKAAVGAGLIQDQETSARRRARCVPDGGRWACCFAAASESPRAAAIASSRSREACWYISAARELEWPIRSISSRARGGRHRVAGMTEVMQMRSRESGVGERHQPDIPEVGPAQLAAQRAHKDQSVVAGLGEALQMPAQLVNDLAPEGNRPAACARLGLLLDQLAVVHLCDRSGYVYRRPIQVEARSAQRSQLTESQVLRPTRFPGHAAVRIPSTTFSFSVGAAIASRAHMRYPFDNLVGRQWVPTYAHNLPAQYGTQR